MIDELADKIDRFLEKAAKSPNTPAPFTRQSGGRANGIFEGLDFLLPDDDIARVECESKDSLPDGGCNPDAQPQESSEKDDNKSKNESTDAGPKKAERADGLNDPNGRGVIQNSESAAASSAAAPLNSSSVRSSLATCQTSQKNEKQAAVPKNKSVKVTAPRQQTVPPAWSMTARLRQTNPKQESSYYYEDDEGWMLLSRLAPGRKRKAETMTKSQPKKPRMASKKQARV